MTYDLIFPRICSFLKDSLLSSQISGFYFSLKNLLGKISHTFYVEACCIEKNNLSSSLREKCLNTEFFLVRIFLYSDWIQEYTDQKKFSIWTLFTQCMICLVQWTIIVKNMWCVNSFVQRLNINFLVSQVLDFWEENKRFRIPKCFI